VNEDIGAFIEEREKEDAYMLLACMCHHQFNSTLDFLSYLTI
jgi:hypothetical protein